MKTYFTHSSISRWCSLMSVDCSSSGSQNDDPLRPALWISGRRSGWSHDAEVLSLWRHRQRRQPHAVHWKTYVIWNPSSRVHSSSSGGENVRLENSVVKTVEPDCKRRNYRTEQSDEKVSEDSTWNTVTFAQFRMITAWNYVMDVFIIILCIVKYLAIVSKVFKQSVVN